MLGNLFGEDEEGFGTVADASSGTGGILPPPRPRLKCNLAGITNQGATCYLNSLLQTLLLTPEFRESLFRIPSEDLGKLEDRDKPGAKVRVIPLQLQRLFVRLLLSNRQSVSTRELTESFGWSNNEELQQHDVQELNRILFTAISDSLAGTCGGRLINNLYHGSIVNQIKCLECENCTEREEDFLDLTLTVSGYTGLEMALSSYYEETELLHDKNQYRCERCNKLVDAKKGARLRKLPPILTISLLRFSYDFYKMERFKELGKFTFPLDLDMSPYSEKPSGNDNYELFSVVIHQGSAYGGHYHAYIKDVDNLGTWYTPDDAEILLEPSKSSKKLDIQEFNSPLLLLEALLKEREDTRLSVDKLGSEMVSRTGVSWNSRFKKQYGPMSKFIKKHDDVFIFDQSKNMVQLKETYTISDVSINQSDVSTQNQRPLSPTPETGQCWYDFNDSRVSPIRQKDIESQFQGKESAYMLFYRQKSLNRPTEAQNNPSYCINDDLLLEVTQDNEEVEREITEYELKINQVKVEIHFGCYYDYTAGALHCVTNSGFVELTLDKRKTVAELLASIHQIGEGKVPSNLVVSRIKDVPAGFHIYDTLTDNVDLLVSDVNIVNGDKLLVWDGQQVGGEIVEKGAEFEPVYLTICTENKSYKSGFPKNMLFRSFVQQACFLLTVSDSEKIIVRKVDSNLKSVILADDNDTSVLQLNELNFKDEDKIILEERKSDSTEIDEDKPLEGDQDGDQDDDQDDNSVNEVKSTEITAVLNSRIKLTFTPGDPKSLRSDEEIILDNTLTVNDCLQCMILQSELPGESWHLRKTNWYGEAAEVLDDPDLTLQMAGVQDRDHLLIEEGKLPPKGFLLLSILLYPNLPTPAPLTNENSGLINWIANGIQTLFVGQNQNETKQASHLRIGDVEIFKESTLEELKWQIMTLPQIAELQLPSIDFLRVRRVNNSKPSTVLRELSHSLKRHKIKTSEDLAVQVLPREEQLSTSEILLDVQQRINETKSYSPPLQVLWDISHGNGVVNLTQTIADALSLPQDQILLAKYFCKRFDWMIIKEKETAPVQNKKGKRKQKIQKVNLRQSPYFIGDGDVIGVVKKGDGKVDFSTPQDFEGKKELVRIAEEKKKQSQRSDSGETTQSQTPRPRRPEVALTIKVDKFT